MPPENARSRTGCLSCRTRRKKCGEDWDENGSCSRCATSHFVCVRPSKVDIIQRRANSARAAEEGGGGGSSKSVRTVDSRAGSGPSAVASSSTLDAPVQHDNQSSSSWTTSPHRSSSFSGPVEQQHLPPPAFQQSTTSPGSSDASFGQPDAASILASIAQSPVITNIHTLPDPPHSHPHPPPSPSPDFNLDNVDLLSSFPELETFLASASHGFASDSLSAPPSPAIPAYAVSSGAGPSFSSGQPSGSQERLPLIYDVDESESLGAVVLKSIGEDEVPRVYNRWNIEFLKYLPKDVQDAVLHWWDYVCVDSPLTRAASTMCALMFCHRQDRFSTDQKARLADVLKQYRQKTLSLVPTFRSKVPLAYALLTYTDLLYVSFDQDGASAAYPFYDLAEQAMLEAFGSAPHFDFCAPPSPSHYTLSILVHLDIFRSVALGRPHTFFHLSHSDESDKSSSGARILSSSSPDSHSPPQPKPLKLFLGLPTELIFCIASTNNLAGSQLPPAEVKQQTVSLEAQIRDWRPSTDHLPEMLDSVATIEWFRTCEAWRHAALILLYQLLHKTGCMSEVLQSSLKQIKELLATPIRPLHTDESLIRTASFPWFLASTVAIHPEDRKACRAGLESCGNARVFQDNLKWVLAFWAHVDRTGREPNWREFKVEGVTLGFM